MTTLFWATLAVLVSWPAFVFLAFMSLSSPEGYLTRLERWWWNGR